jgi:hypothetical protein
MMRWSCPEALPDPQSDPQNARPYTTLVLGVRSGSSHPRHCSNGIHPRSERELLYDLCAALVKAGLGSPQAWQRCGETQLSSRNTAS